MPITFDTLDELKAFYRTFRLDEKAGKKALGSAMPDVQVGEGKPRRGRPGRKPTGLKTTKTIVKKPTGAKRGPKPKTTVVAKKTAKTPRTVSVRKGDTLTAKIRNTIQKFLDAKRAFTANDIYADLVQQKHDVNKQSVITSVLKQMNSTFKTVSVKDRPGNGPRPVKYYNS